MDVTCERCGTEYEFDETLVSERGTTVKCTNCGHLFKVFRPDADAGPRHWKVRSGDGTVRTLSSLKELQRLITAGQLSEVDLIARGDEEYKRLGDIAELATFFAAATADTDIGIDHTGRERRGTSPGMAAAPPLPPRPPGGIPGDATIPDSNPIPRPPPRPKPSRKDTLLGGHSNPGADEDPPTLPERAPAPPPRLSPPRSLRPGGGPRPPSLPHSSPPAPAPRAHAAPTPAPIADLGPATMSSGPAPPSAPPQGGKGLYLDAEEPVAPPRARSLSGLWVALVVVLVLAVSVALGWPQIAPLLGLVETPVSPVDPHNAAGDEAIAEDTISGYERAVSEYTQALAHAEHDPEVLTRLSRAHATWAQALHFDADDLEARAGRDPALGGEAAAVRREERRHAETALARAEDAVRYGGGSAEAEVALADALRLTGDTTRGRSRFERALTLNSARSAETLRVQALLTAAEAGSLGGARDLAEEAVGEDPSMIRARLLYARALLVARDIAGARSQLEAVLRRTARHPRATALRDAIDQGIPPAPPTVEVGDGGIGAEDTTPSSTDPTPPPVETPSGNDNGGGNGGGSGGGGGRRDPVATPDRGGPVPAGRDYSWYVRMGDEQVDRGNAARAGEFYEAARTVRPSGSEALTGLGYVALEQGNPAGAVTKFRQAAQQGYAEAYIGLGAAYQRLGRSQDALTAYERYLERLPSGPRAATARQHVDELRRQLGSGGGSEGSGGSENEGSGSSGTGGSGTGGSGTGGSGTGGSGTGGSGTEGTGGSSAPPTDEGALPPPRDMQGPPPEDVPAVGSEP